MIIKSNSKNLLAVFFIFATSFSWATAGVFIKLLPNFGAFEILSLRFLISFAVLTFYLVFKNRLLFTIKELKNKKIWILVIFLLGCYYFGTLAFTLAPIGETTLLMAVSPVFIFLYKYLLKKEKIYRIETVGFILAISGICIFLYINQGINGTTQLYGNISALLVGVLFASYAIVHKKADYISYNSLSISYGMFILMIIPAIYYLSDIVKEISLISIEIVYIVLIGIVSTVIPTLSIIYAAKNLSSMAISSVFILEIFFGFVLGYILFDEVQNLFIIFTLSIILIGTVLMIFNKRKSL